MLKQVQSQDLKFDQHFHELNKGHKSQFLNVGKFLTIFGLLSAILLSVNIWSIYGRFQNTEIFGFGLIVIISAVLLAINLVWNFLCSSQVAKTPINNAPETDNYFTRILSLLNILGLSFVSAYLVMYCFSQLNILEDYQASSSVFNNIVNFQDFLKSKEWYIAIFGIGLVLSLLYACYCTFQLSQSFRTWQFVIYFLSIFILAISFVCIWGIKNIRNIIPGYELSGENKLEFLPYTIIFIVLITLIVFVLITIYVNTNAIKSLYMIVAIFFLIACGILIIQTGQVFRQYRQMQAPFREANRGQYYRDCANNMENVSFEDLEKAGCPSKYIFPAGKTINDCPDCVATDIKTSAITICNQEETDYKRATGDDSVDFDQTFIKSSWEPSVTGANNNETQIGADFCLNAKCCGVVDTLYSQHIARFLYFNIALFIMTFCLGAYTLYASIFEKADRSLHVEKSVQLLILVLLLGILIVGTFSVIYADPLSFKTKDQFFGVNKKFRSHLHQTKTLMKSEVDEKFLTNQQHKELKFYTSKAKKEENCVNLRDYVQKGKGRKQQANWFQLKNYQNKLLKQDKETKKDKGNNRHFATASKTDKVDPKATGAKTDPKAAGAQTDPKATGAKTDPKAAGAQTDPKTTGAKTDPKATDAKTDPKATGAKTDPKTDTKANPSENNAKDKAGTKSSDAKADPKAASSNKDSKKADSNAASDTKASDSKNANKKEDKKDDKKDKKKNDTNNNDNKDDKKNQKKDRHIITPSQNLDSLLSKIENSEFDEVNRLLYTQGFQKPGLIVALKIKQQNKHSEGAATGQYFSYVDQQRQNDNFIILEETSANQVFCQLNDKRAQKGDGETGICDSVINYFNEPWRSATTTYFGIIGTKEAVTTEINNNLNWCPGAEKNSKQPVEIVVQAVDLAQLKSWNDDFRSNGGQKKANDVKESLSFNNYTKALRKFDFMTYTIQVFDNVTKQPLKDAEVELYAQEASWNVIPTDSSQKSESSNSKQSKDTSDSDSSSSTGSNKKRSHFAGKADTKTTKTDPKAASTTTADPKATTTVADPKASKTDAKAASTTTADPKAAKTDTKATSTKTADPNATKADSKSTKSDPKADSKVSDSKAAKSDTNAAPTDSKATKKGDSAQSDDANQKKADKNKQNSKEDKKNKNFNGQVYIKNPDYGYCYKYPSFPGVNDPADYKILGAEGKKWYQANIIPQKRIFKGKTDEQGKVSFGYLFNDKQKYNKNFIVFASNIDVEGVNCRHFSLTPTDEIEQEKANQNVYSYYQLNKQIDLGLNPIIPRGKAMVTLEFTPYYISRNIKSQSSKNGKKRNYQEPLKQDSQLNLFNSFEFTNNRGQEMECVVGPINNKCGNVEYIQDHNFIGNTTRALYLNEIKEDYLIYINKNVLSEKFDNSKDFVQLLPTVKYWVGEYQQGPVYVSSLAQFSDYDPKKGEINFDNTDTKLFKSNYQDDQFKSKQHPDSWKFSPQISFLQFCIYGETDSSDIAWPFDIRKDTSKYATYNLWGSESSIYTSYKDNKSFQQYPTSSFTLVQNDGETATTYKKENICRYLNSKSTARITLQMNDDDQEQTEYNEKEAKNDFPFQAQPPKVNI